MLTKLKFNLPWAILFTTVVGFSVLLGLTVSIRMAITDFYAHHTLIAENKSWETAYYNLEEKYTNFIANSVRFAATTGDIGTLVVWTESETDSVMKEKFLKRYWKEKQKFNEEQAKNAEIEMQ